MNDVTLVSIPFHGKPLVTFQHNGEPHAAMRPIVDGMGLDWSAQFRRIKRNPIFESTIAIMATVAEDGKAREMVALPIKMLNGWLFGIDVDRVKPELRETILAYQRECYDVLYRYWHEGRAERFEAGSFDQKVVELAEKYHKSPTPLAQQLIFERIIKLHEAHSEVVSADVLRLHHDNVPTEHPEVKRFWVIFETLEASETINHSIDAGLIAINMRELERYLTEMQAELIPINMLKKLLPKSRSHIYLGQKTVRSAFADKGVHCWVFKRGDVAV